MQIEVLKSKIHRVTITQANLDYVGSITVDEELLEAANMIPGEKVQVVNVNNGERLETYIIKGERGSGAVCFEWSGGSQVCSWRRCDHHFLCAARFRGGQKFQAVGCFPGYGNQSFGKVV